MLQTDAADGLPLAEADDGPVATLDERGRATGTFRALVAALLVGLALLVAAGAAVFLLALAARSETSAVEETLEVDRLTADIQAAVRAAEADARAYVITRNPDYLATTSGVAVVVGSLLDQLAARTAGIPEQSGRVEALRRLMPARLAHLNEIVRLAGAGDLEGARRAIEDPANQALRRQAIDEIVAFRNAQRRLLAEAREDQGATSSGLLFAVAAALIGVLVTATLAFVVVRRSIRGLHQSQQATADLNASLDAQVKERTAKLAAANAEIQRFAYIVSHDLRSPLVNIMGFTDEVGTNLKTLGQMVERLKETHPDAVTEEERLAIQADMPEALAYIKASTSKMDRLINAILRLSREGRRPLTAERLDLKALAHEIALTLEKRAEARDASIEIGDMPTMIGDRLAVEQILSNVVENAVKYGRAGVHNRVTVSGERKGSRVIVTVADTGRGIEPQDRERVFGLFRRAGAQDQPGEGLGLAFVRAIVQRLGGEIGFTSTPGQGTVFRIDLPYAMKLRSEKVAA